MTEARKRCLELKLSPAQLEHKIITAFLARSSAAGWLMLPVKATEVMSEAGAKVAPPGMITGGPLDAFQICWEEMAKAAPFFIVRYSEGIAKFEINHKTAAK